VKTKDFFGLLRLWRRRREEGKPNGTPTQMSWGFRVGVRLEDQWHFECIEDKGER